MIEVTGGAGAVHCDNSGGAVGSPGRANDDAALANSIKFEASGLPIISTALATLRQRFLKEGKMSGQRQGGMAASLRLANLSLIHI